jgi:FtsH-binding integral membrane protein
METSLFFKTFVVFGSQLSLVFGICYYFIYGARKAALAGEPFYGAVFEKRYNKNGELDLFSAEEEEYDKWALKEEAELNALFYKDKLAYEKRKKDLEIEMEYKKPPLRKLLFNLCVIWFIALCATSIISVTGYSILIKMIMLSIASMLFGPILGAAMIGMDENDGLRILKLTVVITFFTAIIGIYSGIDFSSLGYILIIPLFILVIWNLLNIFINFTSASKRIMGFFGSIIFIGYLLFDFYRLEQASADGINDWNTAFNIGFSIYLDVINLLLELLEAMG